MDTLGVALLASCCGRLVLRRGLVLTLFSRLVFLPFPFHRFAEKLRQSLPATRTVLFVVCLFGWFFLSVSTPVGLLVVVIIIACANPLPAAIFRSLSPFLRRQHHHPLSWEPTAVVSYE